MKKLTLMLVAAAMSTTLLAQKPTVVVSDKDGWHKIGETTVDYQKEEDEIAVLIADRFAHLKFKVTNAPIEISDIDVYFEEGDKQTIKIGRAIKPEGTESKPIDLKGGSERDLKKIVFRYKTAGQEADKKARLEIWGKKTNTDKAANKEKDGKMKEKTSEAKKDVKDASKEAKKDTKKAVKETKKDVKKAKNEVEEEMEN